LEREAEKSGLLQKPRVEWMIARDCPRHTIGVYSANGESVLDWVSGIPTPGSDVDLCLGG
jgi:hypothetical protein